MSTRLVYLILDIQYYTDNLVPKIWSYILIIEKRFLFSPSPIAHRFFLHLLLDGCPFFFASLAIFAQFLISPYFSLSSHFSIWTQPPYFFQPFTLHHHVLFYRCILVSFHFAAALIVLGRLLTSPNHLSSSLADSSVLPFVLVSIQLFIITILSLTLITISNRDAHFIPLGMLISWWDLRLHETSFALLMTSHVGPVKA